jgi:hypothetical protein
MNNKTIKILKSTVESHCNRLEVMEDRISSLEDNVDFIEKKPEEYIQKKMKK